jgi:ribonuclease-3
MHTLEKKINHKFNNKKLLLTALTHRSANKQNNQRLEYLGDAVLDCIIAEKLYKQYPEFQEGLLSQHRASLVNKESLSEIAIQLDILPHIILGPGEKKQLNVTESILADTLEALIGAIYLDTDFATCKELILAYFADKLANLNLMQNEQKDSKSLLQELCQANNLTMPKYTIVDKIGKEHNQTFKAQCILNEKTSFGIGKSIKKAEQDAALNMLKNLEKL